MKSKYLFFCFTFLFVIALYAQNKNLLHVKTEYGVVEGVVEKSGVYAFKGIPYAAPPVGDLRWKEPQPPAKWTGIKQAKAFGPKPMQLPLYSDMQFRSSGMSEDCLYLNIWSPSDYQKSKFPVLVYFHGGGLAAGDGSEKRYDGEYMATKGIVMVTLNYRLGVFGFFAHPELTKESVHHTSGNYGFLDQHAALVWIKKNIAAFGGDPEKITIAGQSAGSRSVSTQMASPLSKNLFRAAIGESGSMFATTPSPTLAEAEQKGIAFAAAANAENIAAFRKIKAEKLLAMIAKEKSYRFGAIIDGYFSPAPPNEIYGTGLQADIPLLAGWNSAEISYTSLLGKDAPTVENYRNAVKKLYGDKAEDFLKQYPAATDNDVMKAATDMASDRFNGYDTWKWIDLQGKTGGKPVYRYLYAHLLPLDDSTNIPSYRGAPHSAEIEYALGTLPISTAHKWNADDYKVSEIMNAYFVNFVKNTNPNGNGLPVWYGLQSSIPKVMIIDKAPHSEPEKNLKRYLFLDQLYNP